MASLRDIPGGIGPFRGMGRISKARLRSSWLMFFQSGIPLKKWWIGPGSAVVKLTKWTVLQEYLGPITLIVKVYFVVFIAVNRRRTWNTGSWFGTKNYVLASISYTISGTILRTIQKDSLCTLDIVLISKKNRRHRVRYSISRVFEHSILKRYRSFDSILGTIS